MKFYWLVLGTFGVWRITHFLSSEDGPWSVVVWVRRKAGTGFWANLLDCFLCLSLWVAIPFALVLGTGVRERFCLWLAFSAGAIVIQVLTRDNRVGALSNYAERGGQEDGVLRQSEISTKSAGSKPNQ